MLLAEFEIDIAKEVWQEEALLEGMEKCIEKGMEEGRKREKYNLAKTMLSDGEPMEKIMRYTGLAREEIESLRDAG